MKKTRNIQTQRVENLERHRTTEKKNHGRIQIPEIETETLSFSEFGLIYTNFVGKVHTAGT